MLRFSARSMKSTPPGARAISPTLARISTVQTALDGTEYLVRFGAPTVHYELTLYVDEAGKALLMSAEDRVSLLECTVKQGVFTGRIVELGDFEYLAAGWYKVEATLAAVSEVSEP